MLITFCHLIWPSNAMSFSTWYKTLRSKIISMLLRLNSSKLWTFRINIRSLVGKHKLSMYNLLLCIYILWINNICLTWWLVSARIISASLSISLGSCQCLFLNQMVFYFRNKLLFWSFFLYMVFIHFSWMTYDITILHIDLFLGGRLHGSGSLNTSL